MLNKNADEKKEIRENKVKRMVTVKGVREKNTAIIVGVLK